MLCGTFGGSDSLEATAKHSAGRAPSPRRKKASRPTLFLAAYTPTLLACPAAHCISLNFVQVLRFSPSVPISKARLLFFSVHYPKIEASFLFMQNAQKLKKRKKLNVTRTFLVAEQGQRIVFSCIRLHASRKTGKRGSCRPLNARDNVTEAAVAATAGSEADKQTTRTSTKESSRPLATAGKKKK